jgi:hypothetical protein
VANGPFLALPGGVELPQDTGQQTLPIHPEQYITNWAFVDTALNEVRWLSV